MRLGLKVDACEPGCQKCLGRWDS